MRLIFFGTPAFAVPALSRLHEAGHKILLVVCQPDRPAGRGRRVTASAVKNIAVSLGLRIDQPEHLDESFARCLLELSPDVAVVVAYGLILPVACLRIPSRGCVNLHASLLPGFRGAAPVTHAILTGERKVGITTILMDEGIDTGPMLLQRESPLGDSETTGEVESRLSSLGADLILETLEKMEQGTLVPHPQPSEGVTYAPKLRPEEARIIWSQPSKRVVRRILALNPRPGARTFRRGQLVKIWRGRECANSHPKSASPGELLEHIGSLHVACGEGTCIEVLEIQLEGRRTISGEEALRGRWFVPGDSFGEGTGLEGGD